MELDQILQSLSEKRPVFHSEADFQHALAWEIQTLFPESHIRLECVIPELRYHMDILVRHEGKTIPIELKYKTRSHSFFLSDEPFALQNHGAQDIGRYDYIKDIARVERTAGYYDNSVGYAILLTNDSGYWQESRNTQTVDAAFRLHEGRVLSGELAWSERAGAGTIKNREQPIVLSGRYPLHWQDYSHNEEAGAFRRLLVRVGG